MSFVSTIRSPYLFENRRHRILGVAFAGVSIVILLVSLFEPFPKNLAFVTGAVMLGLCCFGYYFVPEIAVEGGSFCSSCGNLFPCHCIRLGHPRRAGCDARYGAGIQNRLKGWGDQTSFDASKFRKGHFDLESLR